MNKYLKLFIVLGASFLISEFTINNVFVAQSPKLNPFFVSNTIAKINNFWSKTGNFIVSINFLPKFKLQNTNNKQTAFNPINNVNNADNQLNQSQLTSFSLDKAKIEKILKAPLNQVSQGVYAGEVDGTQVYEVRTNEIDYLEYTFNVKGKEIKIKVPKDQRPPSQEEMEVLYK